MVVVTLTVCPDRLRGDLTRWLLEIDTGVYCGNLSGRVRDNLWDRITKNIGDGRAVMVYSAQNEQHLQFRIHNADRIPIDCDGIQLIYSKGKGDLSEADKVSEEDNKEKRLITLESEKQVTREKCPTADEYVVLDIETTGLDPEKDKILELAAIKIKSGKIEDTKHFLVSTDSPVPDYIVKLTRIDNEMLEREGKSMGECLPSFLNFISGKRIVSHNADFDLKFIKKAATECGLTFIAKDIDDTLLLARKKMKGIKNYKLQTILEYFHFPEKQTHRALEDCFITWSIYKKLNEIQG